MTESKNTDKIDNTAKPKYGRQVICSPVHILIKIQLSFDCALSLYYYTMLGDFQGSMFFQNCSYDKETRTA